MSIEFDPIQGLSISGEDLGPYRDLIDDQAQYGMVDSPSGPYATGIRALAYPDQDPIVIADPNALALLHATATVATLVGPRNQRRQGLAVVIAALAGGHNDAIAAGEEYHAPTPESLRVAGAIADLLAARARE
jgi:hypothetical protein